MARYGSTLRALLRVRGKISKTPLITKSGSVRLMFGRLLGGVTYLGKLSIPLPEPDAK